MINAPLIIPHLCGVRVSGRDAVAYLHSQLTHDLHAQATEHWQISAWCDPKGRCLMVLLVAMTSDPEPSIDLIVPRSQGDDLLHRLQMFSIGRQVDIGSVQAVLSDAQGWPMAQDPKRRLRLLDPAAADSLSTSADPEPITQWRQRDLQLPLPWLTPQSSGQHLPQALGLDRHQAFSTKKGCYPGQEVIARLHFLGQSKRQLLTIDDLPDALSPNPGEACVDEAGTPVADLLDAVAPFGLAVSRRRVEGPIHATLVGALVTLKPFPATISSLRNPC
jgi:folate-binding protein YgfZ